MSELDVIQGFFEKEQKEKIDKYRILNETVIKGQILFTGSSLMEQFPINGLYYLQPRRRRVHNRCYVRKYGCSGVWYRAVEDFY